MLTPKPLFKITHIPLLQRGKTHIIVYQKHLVTWWFIKLPIYMVVRRYIKRGIYKDKDVQFNNHDQVREYLKSNFGLN